MNKALLGKHRIALCLIPIYSLVFLVIFLNKAFPFHLTQPDPCYVYLFNGMNLAGGHWEVGHTDHPGTTVQVFAALVIFIRHLFTSPHTLLYQDVILNPENYLLACSIILISLFVSVNYLTGAYVLRHSGNISTAMLFQMVPLIQINIIQRTVLLNPEAFITICSSFFMAYLYVHFIKDKTDPEYRQRNTTLTVSIFSAFLIATKYTCIPVVFLVLFLLKGRKDRLKYLAMLLIGFFVFIIPALPKFNIMFGWIWNLLTHDGIYGKGQERIINPSQFIANLKGIFITDAVFTSMYGVITLGFLTAIVQMARRKASPLAQAAIGVWLSITALITAVAKHCDFHYLIFAECCFPLGLYIAYKVITYAALPLISEFKRHEKQLLWGFFGALLIFLVIEKIRYIPMRHPKYSGADKCFANYKSAPLIISVNGSMACERKEPALYLGYMYSGALQSTYAAFLNKIYPDTYILWDTSRPLTHWSESAPIADVLDKNRESLLYLKGYSDTVQEGIAAGLSKLCNKKESSETTFQEIYKDAPTMQAVYLIHHANPDLH
ncbi:MAG: hypothetical protein HKL88_06200 [Bacteroidia bacterium]|nr:hypothetical protein [Bacteroidia bacterium]